MDERSPFHRGERTLQRRADVREQTEGIGRRLVRGYLPHEHRAFYEELRYLVVGSLDDAGRPWASILAGPPGFVSSPDPETLCIAARPSWGDPLQGNLGCGAQVGILGIQFDTRRRNRVTGRVRSCGEGQVNVRVDQTFGNCPKFIQSRQVIGYAPPLDTPLRTQPLTRLDRRAREIIESADHFFIATHFAEEAGNPTQGADVSHRGGRPGFVRIDDDDRTLTFPDFSGNNHFNTLGNIALNPVAGLLFIDFASGDLLYLTCRAEIVWDGSEITDFVGAERFVRFTITAGRRVERSLPLTFQFREYSPFLGETGSWDEVAQKQAAREVAREFREFEVVRVEQESASVTSFYLEPRDDEHITCHRAGQFLPIEVALPGAAGPVQRTYTISNAPNGRHYRLSIKRETPVDAQLPGGLISNHFHDQIRLGSVVRALSPRGRFTLDTAHKRPVVMLSAGVGITPMISMLEQLAADRASCGCRREICFVHGARNSTELAFGSYVRGFGAEWPELTTHIRFSQPGPHDRRGRDYDSEGRIDARLLESLPRLSEADVYLCGPTGFMEGSYESLRTLGVDDGRIHYEYFGPGRALSKENVHSVPQEIRNQPPVPVRFTRAGIEVTWDPTRGTLLDLAESVGLEPPYSCRSGACQTCAVRLTAGSVAYVDPPATPPPEGMALICSAYPAAPGDEDQVEPLFLEL